MARSLDARIERLEATHGFNERTVQVTIPCERCGHPLTLDDRGSACGTHPRIPRADQTINIEFVTPLESSHGKAKK